MCGQNGLGQVANQKWFRSVWALYKHGQNGSGQLATIAHIIIYHAIPFLLFTYLETFFFYCDGIESLLNTSKVVVKCYAYLNSR